MHTSIPMEMPVEFINVTPLNPLISKCQIKVCYVDDKPNRNRSVITKEVARKMANSLPGSPIVGYYNEGKADYEEHNRVIDISAGKFEIKDTTRPYGFVDLGAKVWFQKFLDDGEVEREYMVTEGYLWTGQYPECQRIIDQGNNQSMELDENTLDATWTKDENGKYQFFIINEAIISKLCILGQDQEPCFEGASITAPNIQFSFDDGFKEQLFSMMKELKDLLQKGGEKVFTTYAVEIGDALWSALYSYIEKTYPDTENCYCSIYRIDGVYEEGDQKFAILQNRSDMKYYRLDFSLSEAEGVQFVADLTEVTKTYTPLAEPQFAEEAVAAYVAEYAKSQEEGKTDSDDENKIDNPVEGETSTEFAKTEEDDDDEEDICPECGKPKDECTCEDEEEEEEKKKYSLEEIPEYIELKNQYSELETKYNQLVADKEAQDAEMATLKDFKAQSEKKEKQAMIDSFYMLSDEDKADVIDNIDTYSLNDIEAKLSIICVRNKVSFDLDENKGDKGPTTYSFNGSTEADANMPAWVKAAIAVSEKKN